MFIRNGIEYEFHHLGVPTAAMHPGERFSQLFAMYTSDAHTDLIRVQWHRFLPESSLDPLVRTLPHVAFKVNHLNRAIDGKKLLLAPYEPIAGFRVAIIEDGGVPIELIETALTDEEIWRRVRAGEGANIK
jgi:hypothetical protein